MPSLLLVIEHPSRATHASCLSSSLAQPRWAVFFFFFFKLRRFYWTKLLAGSCGENNLTGKGYNFLIPRRDPLSQVLATMYMLFC